MFPIGKFSRISRLSVKTLRYYDQIGLLKPARVDPATGYRYYELDQLARLNRILALKDLGLTLEQTAVMLDRGLTAEQLRAMLRRKRAELTQAVHQTEDRLARVDARLKQIDLEGKMPDYEIVIKELPPLNVASVRGIIPTYPQQGHLWDALEKEMKKQGVWYGGPCFTRYLDGEYRDHDIDTNVCAPVAIRCISNGPMKVYELPGGTLAVTVHHGPFTTLGSAYGALLKWIEENGYRIIGPEREIYLKTGVPLRQDDTSYVTEIQFPVTRKPD